MSAERELLERAAKAAGYTITEWCQSPLLGCYVEEGHSRGFRWSPLADDGDALRLAVKLRISVELWARSPMGVAGRAVFDDNGVVMIDGEATDPLAATRRAIVRAAAEMAGI